MKPKNERKIGVKKCDKKMKKRQKDKEETEWHKDKIRGKTEWQETGWHKDKVIKETV